MLQNKHLRMAFAVVVLLNMGILVSPFMNQNWDSQMHLFFASHYTSQWFDAWDKRWYGGFFVFCTAPLVHQLIALLSFVSSLEIAYIVIQALAMLLMPFSVYYFTSQIAEERIAGLAALLSTGVGGIYVLLYTFGQLPAFIAMEFVILASGLLIRSLKTDNQRYFSTWMLISSIAVCCNHHTAIVTGGIFTAVFSIRYMKHSTLKYDFFRLACIAVGFIGSFVWTIGPFWWWYFTISDTQASIYHASRDMYLGTWEFGSMFFWDQYGGFILLLPLGLFFTFKHRKLRTLNLVIIIFFFLGLGGNTPIARLITGPLWETLTYERFSFMAAILSTIPVAYFITTWKKKHFNKLFALMVVLIFIGVVKAITFPSIYDLLQKPLVSWQEQEIVKFLDEHKDGQYITVGLGEPELTRISRLTKAYTIDGFYNQARTDEELRMSGISTIDSAPWSRDKGLPLITDILKSPENFNLRWVVNGSAETEDLLRKNNWTLLHPIGSQIGWKIGDKEYSTVTVWEAPKDKLQYLKPPLNEENISMQLSTDSIVLNVWWGIIPCMFFVWGISYFIYLHRKEFFIISNTN